MQRTYLYRRHCSANDEHWSLFEKWCIIKENYGLAVVDIRRWERGTDHMYFEQKMLLGRGLFPGLNYVEGI